MKKTLLALLFLMTVTGLLSGCNTVEEIMPSAAPTMEATASPNATATAGAMGN